MRDLIETTCHVASVYPQIRVGRKDNIAEMSDLNFEIQLRFWRPKVSIQLALKTKVAVQFYLAQNGSTINFLVSIHGFGRRLFSITKFIVL